MDGGFSVLVINRVSPAVCGFQPKLQEADKAVVRFVPSTLSETVSPLDRLTSSAVSEHCVAAFETVHAIAVAVPFLIKVAVMLAPVPGADLTLKYNLFITPSVGIIWLALL